MPEVNDFVDDSGIMRRSNTALSTTCQCPQHDANILSMRSFGVQDSFQADVQPLSDHHTNPTMASSYASRLTHHLLALSQPSFVAATQHPFLHAAGNGTLSKHALSAWLSQDRLYAQSYIRFIGLLLSKTRLPSSKTIRSSLQWRITDMLIEALTNIRREIQLFERTAAHYDLDLQTPWEGQESFEINTVTRGYVDLFMSAAGPGTSLLEGLVVLWATEKCYFEAWTYAGRLRQEGKFKQGDGADGGVLGKELIPNWTSAEFAAFMGTVGGLVDELGKVEGVMENDEERRRCEEVWWQVLWLEERFWPVS